MRGSRLRQHPWLPLDVLHLMKFEHKLVQSQPHISLHDRLMARSWAPELRMLLPNRNEREQYNKNEKHNCELHEQKRQPDLMKNKEVRILEGLPPVVVAVAAVRTLTIATDVLIRIKVLTQKIRPIGQTSTSGKSSDSSVRIMNLISAPLFGSYMSDGGMPVHLR